MIKDKKNNKSGRNKTKFVNNKFKSVTELLLLLLLLKQNGWMNI